MKEKSKKSIGKVKPDSGGHRNFFAIKPNQAFLFILLVAFACFGKVIFFGFLDYDDNLFLVDNHKILSDSSNIINLFKQGIWSFINFTAPYDYYRPFLILSLMLDAKIGGMSTVVYHASNLIYHVLACYLLFRLLLKLNVKKETALVFTLIFTVHPVITQAVVWIPGRNDILLSIFIIGSFLCFIEYLQYRKIVFLLYHYILFFLALLTKETALALSAICFLYYALLLNKKIFSRETAGYAFRWMLLMAVYFFIRATAIGQTQNSMTPGLLFDTFIYRIPSIIQYAGKAVFPFNLSVKPTQEDTGYLWGLAALLVLIVSLYLSHKKNYKMIIFGAAWSFLFLLAALILPKNLNDNLFEHRLYLPLMGVFIIINESVLFKNVVFYSTRRIAMSIGVIVLFAFLTFRHSDHFKDGLSFWKNAAFNSPHDLEAQFFLSKQYYKAGNAVDAEQYLLKTLSMKPGYKRANAGLAVIYARNGDMEKAKKYYEEEIRMGSKDKEDYIGLASVLKNLRMIDESIVCFKRALQFDSTDQVVNEHLASLYFEQENYPEAKKIWERMNILEPSRKVINSNLAILYYRTGDFLKALTYAEAEEKIGGKLPDGFIQNVKKKIGRIP